MSSDENDPSNANATAGQKRKGALQLGPRKKLYVTCETLTMYTSLTCTLDISSTADPLVHYGRHFGRTVHALCTVSALLNNGILRMGELAERAEDTFTHEYVMSLPSVERNINWPNSVNVASIAYFNFFFRWYQDLKSVC